MGTGPTETRLGIIAAGGVLPRLVAEAARDAGLTPVIIAIADGLRQEWPGYCVVRLPWSKTGDVFSRLSEHGVSRVVFCGTISVRPDYRSMIPSLRTLKLMPELLRMVRGGDDSLLRAVAGLFERRGFEVVSVHSILRNVLTPLGTLTQQTPDKSDRLALQRASAAATEIGRLDIGQAVVASPDRIIAVEGIEGTRAMLERVGELRANGRIGRGEPCVLFKAFKPQQDERFDLPSIGTETIEQAGAAGLRGIGLTPGRSLILEVGRVVDAANAKGLFVTGASAEDGGAAT
ncbi:LpxI family protein [Aureimonas phyllosphaerae]|uniref:LpxI family protein n=1 Tax=Aureimonas phyllosphaerae TaxID=1166078 RepID=UPI003A5C05BB